jgi:hypothetical protein
MRRPDARSWGMLAWALGLLPLAGCASLGHKHKSHPACREPTVTGDVRNLPPLRVPPGLDAPDTRNAIKVPPLPETARARLPEDPCLSDPPSFGNLALGTAADAVKSSEGHVSWHVNGGAALTTGSSSDYLNSGWTLGGGFAWRPRPVSRLSLQFDLAWATFNASSKFVNLGQQKLQYNINGGSGSVWSLTAAGKYTVPFTASSNGYALLGIGGYHESVQLTETGIYGGYVCDPWGFCYPYAAPGDVVAASKSRTMFGWNLGLGVIESRYHHIAGQRSITYLPIQIGYRF